jgi:hypothetical protein
MNVILEKEAALYVLQLVKALLSNRGSSNVAN